MLASPMTLSFFSLGSLSASMTSRSESDELSEFASSPYNSNSSSISGQSPDAALAVRYRSPVLLPPVALAGSGDDFAPLLSLLKQAFMSWSSICAYFSAAELILFSALR